MLRVALVLDDYNELIYLQTILRKIGIDVEGLQNVKKYEELSLGFNPQVLITSAFGKKVNGLEFIKNLHRVRGFPRLIVLTTSDRPLSKEEAEATPVDQFMQSPVNPKNLIMSLAQLGNVDEKSLLDKFEKLQSQGFGVDENIQLVGQEDAPVIGNTPRFSFRDGSPNEIPTATESSSSSFKLKKDEASSGVSTLDIAPGEEEALSQAAGLTTERSAKYKEYLAKLEPLKNANATSYKRDTIFQFNKKIRMSPLPEDIQQIEQDRKEFVKHLFTKKD